jgi:hypothetical protein
MVRLHEPVPPHGPFQLRKVQFVAAVKFKVTELP